MDMRNIGAGFWVDPNQNKPYPGQRVLCCYRSETKAGTPRYEFSLLRYELHGWVGFGGVGTQPWRWATVIAPREVEVTV